MAGGKTTTENVDIQEELNLDKQVTVKSIAGWKTGFERILSVGDVNIAPNGSVRLTRNEIISQVQSGNKLLGGIDGEGSHATLLIEDAATREYLNFNGENVFSDERVKDIFALKSRQAFENACANTFITRAEKYALIQAIKRLKINDYSKIRYIEAYSGFKLED